MTLEEKAAMCSGDSFFSTKGLKRFGIPSISMSDGPHGLRKQDDSADILGLNASTKATCFPPEVTLASSFDRRLIQNVGKALGVECQALGVSILLGPAINIKRSPLCGRNFEYLSEDPYLTAEMASAYIDGVQSEGVGTSLKHFAANNQEDFRLSLDVRVDERTLREIYLSGFEAAVIKSQPWTVMCAYNKVNGHYCSENKYLLSDILRDEWGFDGFVVSDWGAVAHRVKAIDAGLDLEMPPSGRQNTIKIIQAVQEGRLGIASLDKVVDRLLRIIVKAADSKKQNASWDIVKHHSIAKEAAMESMVLLKNDQKILPLKKDCDLALIGAMAKIPRYQGAGSSHVNPSVLDDIYEEIKKKTNNITYADGYERYTDRVDESLIKEAKEAALHADTAIVFAGLTEEYESEGYDRPHMRMPENHIRLIEEVTKVQENTVVVLCNGAPVEMPWIGNVRGLIEAYLGGQAFGGAIADILFGDANPCGKLAETFPARLSHNPSHINFPGEQGHVDYKEGLFIGYRYYDTKQIAPLFPFGYGLTYTSFVYTGMSLDKTRMTDEESLQVSINIKNVGEMAGKEIVQLYVGKRDSNVIRPVKELKGFEKIYLEPGEEKTVTFSLGKRSFAYYDTTIHDWFVESGVYRVMAASSAEDIRLEESVYIESTERITHTYTRYSTLGELMDDPDQKRIYEEIIGYLRGEGALLSNLNDNPKMAEGMLRGMALCSVYGFSNTAFDEETLQDILRRLNKND